MRKADSDQADQMKLVLLGGANVVEFVFQKAALQTGTRNIPSYDSNGYEARPRLNSFAIYKLSSSRRPKPSFRRYLLERLRAMQKIVRIGFGNEPSLVGLLHKVFVSLLLSKVNGVIPRCKVQVCSLQIVGRGLPSHQRILPSMSLLQYVPIHPPVMTMPVSRLRSCLCGPVYSMSINVSSGSVLL